MTTDAGYEFTAAQNDIFQRLVRNMARSGIIVVVASLIFLAYHFIDYFGLSLGAAASPAVLYIDYAVWFLLAIIGVITGVLLVRATAAFTALIKTEGNDIDHLMFGMGRLADILGLVFWAATAGSVLLAISFVLLLTYS
jgi:hypothetical protein